MASLAVILYTCVAFEQLSVMKSQLNVYNKQAEVMQSQLFSMAATPVITGFDPYPLTVGKLQKLGFDIENPRTTPARITGCKVKFLAKSTTEAAPDIDDVDEKAASCGGYVVSQHPLHMNFEAPWLSEEGLRQILADTLRLYFVGKLQYEDGFGRRLWLPFCKVWLVASQWQECPVRLPASR